MSDTSRTDAWENKNRFDSRGAIFGELVELSRQLERELAAVKAERDALRRDAER